MNKKVGVIFDGSYEGFFTIIYNHYYEKIDPVQIIFEDEFQQILDVEYVTYQTDLLKASKVMNAIANKFSPKSILNLYYSYLSADKEKFINMFKYVVLGFKLKKDLDSYLKEDAILKVNGYYRNVSMESMKQTEFCRFAETKSGVYYCDISPMNNVLPLVAEFFTERFKTMNWVIHDVGREIAAIYDTKECYFNEAPKNAKIIYSESEENYQKLWVKFYKTIAIKERENPKIQNLMMPKRYRKHMTEMKHIEI